MYTIREKVQKFVMQDHRKGECIFVHMPPSLRTLTGYKMLIYPTIEYTMEEIVDDITSMTDPIHTIWGVM
jgi:hypothetical protein